MQLAINVVGRYFFLHAFGASTFTYQKDAEGSSNFLMIGTLIIDWTHGPSPLMFHPAIAGILSFWLVEAYVEALIWHFFFESVIVDYWLKRLRRWDLFLE